MDEIMIGTCIKNRREALGMSQEELCEGYCSVSTISRIENNSQIPSRSLAKGLLGRLGLSDDLLAIMVDQKSTTTRVLVREIRNDLIRYHRAQGEERVWVQEQIKEKLLELEKIVKPKDRSAQQFLLARKALLGGHEGTYDCNSKLAMQLSAIRITHPRFDPEDFQHSHYSIDETRLIGQIASTYAEMGQRRRAIDMYRQLLRYVEKNDKELSGYANHFCFISHNYAIDLTLEKRYSEAIEIAEKAQKVSRRDGSYQYLPGLLAVQAECWYFLGQKEKSKKLYLQAYYTYEAYADENNRDAIRQEMKEHLGIEIAD